ncbi:COX5B-domain-containing protein [Calocera cornea HHB12733]|uniref:COX5B-domain-containing protein n=1 Tax=Calocera cornea HHB12733 TaxID=1353952 RepID=A0A165D3H4_9BASI|nr:COX5B-domain-containing protein [Calocera cornea HHB12733]
MLSLLRARATAVAPRMAPRVLRAAPAFRTLSTSALRKSDDHGHAAPPTPLYGEGSGPGQVPTDVDQATGLERLQLLGQIEGIDVFDQGPLEVTRMGTMADPIQVQTLTEERIVGCTGFPADSHDTIWMAANTTVQSGIARCPECGCVYKLRDLRPELEECTGALRIAAGPSTWRPLRLPPHGFGSCLRYLSAKSRSLASENSTPKAQTVNPPTAAKHESEPERQAPTDKPKSKAKPTASLRRGAKDSAPIRTKAAREIRPVFTVSTAERYILSRLSTTLAPGWKMLPLPEDGFEEAIWIPQWRGAEVFVFKNGSYVCWGLNEDEAIQFGKEVISSVRDVEVGPLRKVETEELDFVADPAEQTRLQGDLIILGGSSPDNNLLARYSFSQALARSSALSALESSLDHYLLSTSGLADTLAEHGHPNMPRKDLIRKMGELLKFRQGVNLNRENFGETPDFYWAEPELEGYFDSVSRALEIRHRMRVVNDKITYAAETQETLRQLLTDTSAHSMELIIIALIAVEVILAFIREGPELVHKTVGLFVSPEPEEPRSELQ